MLKKIYIITLIHIGLILFLPILFCNSFVYADESDNAQKQLEETVYCEIENIDFSFLDNLILEMNNQSKDIFESLFNIIGHRAL